MTPTPQSFVSEIVRFVLPARRVADFARLRAQIASHGAVLSQYYGPTMPARSSLAVRVDEMCWVINWRSRPTNLATQLAALGDHGATSLLFEFKSSQEAALAKALDVPLCQFVSIASQEQPIPSLTLLQATINVVAKAPTGNPDFQASMHKTYTDCFLADDGFVGGDWAYASNTNRTNGQPLCTESASEPSTQILPLDRRLAVYFLGWTSHAAHDAYSATPLFAEEIDKLKSWFGPGTGAWYVQFAKH
ncbi:uncharacterized protein SPSK_05526 [Sporothrix schenckii 1099-18]|uniref:EthD domain-containing protein n=2 Tax=Sporothrix schenckii TaxID=29908 RepID=U7Q5Z3_SPOS1|nr:uncharacterized protein SPSK_05526 [Sporothrix schenckii 1099-18]ERT02410.1 hypothetical protein HMPREF1624_00708 [Sporothrix schenckii ATCC 58251]KJR80320.1 hypothetical protein SPSK_05526 [Sporothrix schenckii 1099-18]